ncbi:hypothetical protein, partial [Clavibacter zhangzhiyongii]|uniref:hypothetical protein n=1 Tax=Clavibacter zhangzhiyongii TaxID=2768071 RepID=UPI001F485D90
MLSPAACVRPSGVTSAMPAPWIRVRELRDAVVDPAAVLVRDAGEQRVEVEPVGRVVRGVVRGGSGRRHPPSLPAAGAPGPADRLPRSMADGSGPASVHGGPG